MATTRARRATVTRKTRETSIAVACSLDGQGRGTTRTGLPFLDHMLQLFAMHGRMSLSVRARGDLEVDLHHTNEDVGLAVGEAVAKAIGSARGIRRFGWAYVPMEEALARVVIDVCGRPKLILRDQRRPKTVLQGSGTPYQWEDFTHWLESFVRASRLTVHVDLLAGRDFHHSCEAVAKALGVSLAQAVKRGARLRGVPSTKGRL